MTPPRRLELICRPTPCHPLKRLSQQLGIELWIKRDDLTGFAMGGNKGRKLEFLIADLLDRGIEVAVTCGGLQSNFIRQLGVACRMHGIRCVAVVMPLPYEEGERELVSPFDERGNVRLAHQSGVEYVHLSNGNWDRLFAETDLIAEQHRADGRRVDVVPVGGSSALGAYAFQQASYEVPSFDFIVCPTSSGSTHAGLAHGFHGTITQVIGVACDPEPLLVEELEKLAAGIDQLWGIHQCLLAKDFNLFMDSVGNGYGVPSSDGDAAAELMLTTEGIWLDPIYSSKAFDGLLKLVREKRIRGKVLFWHTGGLPSVFARTD